MDLFRDASVVIESRNVGARLIEIKDMDGNNIKLMSY